jgi:hypothetical protein
MKLGGFSDRYTCGSFINKRFGFLIDALIGGKDVGSNKNLAKVTNSRLINNGLLCDDVTNVLDFKHRIDSRRFLKSIDKFSSDIFILKMCLLRESFMHRSCLDDFFFSFHSFLDSSDATYKYYMGKVLQLFVGFYLE